LADARATALVIGRSRRSRWFRWRHGSVVNRLAETLSGVALHVVPMPGAAAPARGGRLALRPQPWRGYAAGALAVVLTTLLALAVQPWLPVNSDDLLYLIPVVGIATRFGQRSAMLTALLAALAYNFFFLPPIHTFTINDPQNIVTFVVLTGAGVVVSQLAGRLKREAMVGARSAAENAAIAMFGQRLAAVADEPSTTATVIEEIAAQLDLSAMMLARENAEIRVLGSTSGMNSGATNPGGQGQLAPVDLAPIDRASAEWAFTRNEITGRGSGTLTASDWQFHPLSTSLGVLAVLAISRRDAGVPVSPERQLLFTTLKGQAALAYERIWLEADTRDLAVLRQRDQLRAALLSSIGHDLRTPLTGVVAAANELAAQQPSSPALVTLVEEAHRLRRFFDDLIEMTRLEAGAMDVRIEAVDLTDAAASAAHDLRGELGDHKLVLDISPTLPLVEADPRLLHHVLINLIGNAARFAPPGSAITLRATRRADGLTLAVLDQGEGLPPGDPARLFDRFTRVAGTDRSGGSGLGLAIVKGFAEAMGASVSAAQRAEGGAAFTLAWPEQCLRRSKGEAPAMKDLP
jgi:two-component system sensor histidine kinase KdpD